MEKCPILNFAYLSFILCQPHPQQDLINHVRGLTSGRGTEKCSIIILQNFVFVMCQLHQPTGRQQIGELTLGRATEKCPIIILQK